ncbi:MAG: serine/threonine-protein kinase, partial [Blastocatellia bacterium]
MSPERWRKINELFEAALERPAGERSDFVARACAGDEELRRRVKAMLDADEKNDLLVDRHALEGASELLRSIESDTAGDDLIGEYRLIREIGHGGMGVVYLAFDTRLERQVALKMLPARLTNDPERVRRFQREARAASALNHPNIITIYDFGQEGRRFYIASEFVEGRTLRDFIGKPDFTLGRIVDVAIQVAGALEAAHAAGIVHRDIKPENIMLRPDGYAKVLDFGLAKLIEPESGGDQADTAATDGGSTFETRAGAILGTVNYMSPEQARGQKVDGRSDLFSLGVVFYELVTGRRPFGGATRNHTMVAIMDKEPPPIANDVEDAPDLLRKIVGRTLVKDREKRYQTAREMIAELEALQSDLVVRRMLGVSGGAKASADFDGTTAEIAAQPPGIDLKRKTTGAISPPGVWRKPGVALAAIIIIAIAAFFYFNLGFGPIRPALTDKDTILLSDFVNTTGDTVFDGTLKHGLEAQLAQSPYLNIFPEERARETLKLMGRPRDEKITREVGREICQRRGIKALLAGEIASLGRNYVITLEAINSQSGEVVARQQAEAEGKEQVLKALGRASTEMREHLGESLASIR